MTQNESPPYRDTATESSRISNSRVVPRTPSRRRLLHLFGAGGVAGLAGCASNTGRGTEAGTESGTETATDPDADEKESLTIAIPSSVTRDGASTHGVIPYFTRITEPLTWPDSKLNVNPWLAEEWEQTGKKTWEFYLRDDVTFHNDDPLNADAVLFSLRKMMTDQPWTKGWLRMTPEGIKKVDDHTVAITTSKPIRLPRAFTHIWHSIQHPDSPPGWGGTIGTGPYKLEELKQDQFATVSAFDNYWRGTPKTKTLTFRTITDQNTRNLALESGEVDVAFDISPSQYKEIKDAQKLRAKIQPLITAIILVFNNTNPPTNDIKLRKALNYAVSQKAVVEGALNGVGEPATGLIPPIVWWSAHDSLPEYGPDKAKAKDLVEQSDYDGETVRLVSSNSPHRVNGPTNPKFAAQIVQQAAADIGVNVEIRTMEQAAFSKAIETGEGGHMFQGNTVVIAALPGDMLERYTVEGGPYTYEKDVLERIESLISKGTSTKNREEARTALAKAQRILVAEEVIMVPLYYKHYVVGEVTGVKGSVYHSTMRHSRFENMVSNQ